jgi:hypothetical protein
MISFYTKRAVPQNAMEALGGREGTAPLILDLGIRWGEWSTSHPGRALAPGKGPPVPIVQEAGWTSEPVCSLRLEEKSFFLCRGSNLDRPVVQSVARQYTDWATRLTLSSLHSTSLVASADTRGYVFRSLGFISLTWRRLMLSQARIRSQ